jgi:hypothetical protein
VLINWLIKNKKSNDSPNTANPATPSPITVPPPKETFKALGKLVFAASAVLEFASVAILIPILPANAEKKAPTIKAGTIIQLVVLTKKEIINNPIEAIITKKNRSLYSALRKANAPSFIDFDIFIIFSLPGFCFKTHLDFKYINNSPISENIIGK